MRIAILCVLVMSVALLAGCTGMVKSSDEVVNTYKRVLDSDMRQLSDDWNYFMLMDRQYRLSRWHMR